MYNLLPLNVMIVIMQREIGLTGSIGGLILVHTVLGTPILILLFRTYFASTPTGTPQHGWVSAQSIF
jgi:ABC-type glycerol-3-phosphate transport system permease component